jgi:hypothetical protein
MEAALDTSTPDGPIRPAAVTSPARATGLSVAAAATRCAIDVV